MAERVPGSASTLEPHPCRSSPCLRSQKRCNRRENFRHRQIDVVCLSCYWNRLLSFLLDHRIADSAQADVGLGPLEAITQALENRLYHGLFALFVTASAYAQRDHCVDLLFDLPYQPDDLFRSLDRHFDLDNRGHELFVEDVL